MKLKDDNWWAIDYSSPDVEIDWSGVEFRTWPTLRPGEWAHITTRYQPHESLTLHVRDSLFQLHQNLNNLLEKVRMFQPWDHLRAPSRSPITTRGKVFADWKTTTHFAVQVRISGLTGGNFGFAVRREGEELPERDVTLSPKDARQIGEFLIELAEQGGCHE